MWQFGFIGHWDEWFRPMPGQCRVNLNLKQGQKVSGPAKNSQLLFNNLMGAFIVLFAGYCLAFLAYLGEQVFSYASRHR